jgi:hypothetical protein
MSVEVLLPAGSVTGVTSAPSDYVTGEICTDVITGTGAGQQVGITDYVTLTDAAVGGGVSILPSSHAGSLLEGICFTDTESLMQTAMPVNAA